MVEVLYCHYMVIEGYDFRVIKKRLQDECRNLYEAFRVILGLLQENQQRV